MKKVLLFALIPFVLSACTMQSASISETLPEVSLNMNDLDISPTVSASATVTIYFGIFVTGANKQSASTNTYGSKTKTSSQAAAAYTLIKSNPEYDFIMYPRYETKTFGGFFVTTETTKVTAKLGKLK
jgi:hypothetical protein